MRTEGKDIAGFVLPYAAGVMTASFVWAEFFIYRTRLTGWIALCLGLALLIFINPLPQRPQLRRNWISVAVLGVLCGLFCYFSCAMRELSSPQSAGFVRMTALDFGRSLQESIDNLPFRNPDTNALLKALITGERSSLSRETVSIFRDSGASHILALSGLHLGIIYAVIARALSFSGNSPLSLKLRSLCIILICGFYTLATGAGDSITRAFLFILLNELGKMLHRRNGLRQIIFSALLIQLVISPLSIRSVGFQLSYAAIAGIAFINPALQKSFPLKGSWNPLKRIWDMASLSISCQITTAPLAWLYFRTFPLYFLITNLIAMPLTSLIIPLALLTLALSGFGLCPTLLLDCVEALASCLTFALATISSM